MSGDSGCGGRIQRERTQSFFFLLITSFPSPTWVLCTTDKKRAPSAGNALPFLPVTWVTFHPASPTHILSPLGPTPPPRVGRGPSSAPGPFCIPYYFQVTCLYLWPLRGGKEPTKFRMYPQHLVPLLAGNRGSVTPLRPEPKGLQVSSSWHGVHLV